MWSHVLLCCQWRIILCSWLNCVAGWDHVIALTEGKNELCAAYRTPELTDVNTSTNIFWSTRSYSLIHQILLPICSEGRKGGKTEDFTCPYPYSLSWQMEISRKNRKDNPSKYSNSKLKNVLSPAYHNYESHLSISCFLPFNSIYEYPSKDYHIWRGSAGWLQIWHMDADRAGTAAKGARGWIKLCMSMLQDHWHSWSTSYWSLPLSEITTSRVVFQMLDHKKSQFLGSQEETPPQMFIRTKQIFSYFWWRLKIQWFIQRLNTAWNNS